ncbi:hypothetical protein KBA63_02515 [Candidatus Woesebacteria bacterium]|nr:hypothetical protein [Candidatus Woesebacteria bacterium]
MAFEQKLEAAQDLFAEAGMAPIQDDWTQWTIGNKKSANVEAIEKAVEEVVNLFLPEWQGKKRRVISLYGGENEGDRYRTKALFEQDSGYFEVNVVLSKMPFMIEGFWTRIPYKNIESYRFEKGKWNIV